MGGELSILGVVLQVCIIDLLLSGDNAVVIALACRSLPRHYVRRAMLMGTGAAVLLRVVLTTLVGILMQITGLKLIAFFLLARWLVNSKFGRVLQAIRDAETRVMFTGYDPLRYKLAIWVISAVMCGIAGALYVPQVGIINPGEMSPAASIEIAIWAAVGGRGTLIGPIVGAFFVNGAKSYFTQAFPEFWLYFLGALFILVTIFLPQGIIGLVRRKKEGS